MSRQRSLTNMNNQNAIDSKGGTITSPGVKRRLSKEKVIASKMIDMKKEKEDLLLSFEKVPEEQDRRDGPSSRESAISPPVPSRTASDSSLVIARSKGGGESTTSHNHVTDYSSTNDYPETQHSRSGSITGSGSPKNARRKGEMSRKMLERLNLFEASNSTGGNGGGSGTSSSNGGGSSSPLPSSPHTSTPLTSPSVLVDERKCAHLAASTYCDEYKIISLLFFHKFSYFIPTIIILY